MNIIIINAKIYTVEPTLPWAEALAIKSGRITHVGSDREIRSLAGPETRIIDLEGHLVLPGLCDAHIHFYDWSLARNEIPLSLCRSKADMLALIKSWSTKVKAGIWLTARGWNEQSWDDSTFPTREEIDMVTQAGQPAILWRSDMHAAVANSAALARASIDASTKDPDSGLIGRDSNGRPNGLLWELAINLVSQHIPNPDAVELDKSLVEATDELHRLGVTAIHDQRMKDQHEGPIALAAYQRLTREHRLKLRLNCNIAAHNISSLKALGLRSGFGSDYLRLGHVKFFADGTMGSKTAWMLRPYGSSLSDDPEYSGIALTSPGQLAAEFQQAIEAGFPISVHAIGDRANREVLDIFEELPSVEERSSAPHRIEHVQIIDPSDLPRLAALDLTASVQPIHALDDMDVADELFGPAANQVYCFGSLLKNRTRLAFGSDAPVADPNPFLGFHAALYRQRPERMSRGAWYNKQRLNLEDIIRGYTIGAAEAAGWHNEIGSLYPGKLADMIVLDRDLFHLANSESWGEEIAQAKVMMTIFDGQVVFDSR